MKPNATTEANSEADDNLLSAINWASENAYGSDNDSDLSAERAQAIDQYLGKNTFPAPEGQSQVQDRSVYEVVQWVMPSLSRIFAGGDKVVELPPIGQEDEEGAKQEEEYLNFVLLQKNNWFEIFDTASKDALLTKAGYLYPYAEKRRQVETEKYERQTPESLTLIMQDQPDLVSHKEYADPDYIAPPPQPQPVIDPMSGQPVPGPDGQPLMQMVPPPPPPMLHDVVIRRVKVETKFCVEVLPPERCKIAKSTKTVQVSRGDYFEYYDFPTISSLRADGYDVPDDIDTEESPDTLEDTARDRYSETQYDENALDPSMRQVRCRWIWIRNDTDGDGIAELQYCVVVGQKILYREEVSRIPVAVLCPDALPHRHIGLCPADATADIQQINTTILRQGLTNLYLANNQKSFIVPGMVNLDDALVSRAGGVIRGKAGAVYGQHFMPIATPDIFPQAIQGLEYMKQIRSSRTGVNSNFEGLDAGQLSQIQPGTVNQISSMAAQRVEQIARHYASGIVELVSILHEVILRSGHKAETVKLRGKWVEIDPSTWRKRTDFRISVGYAAGNKDALVSRLMMIAQMQEKAMAGGLDVATQDNVYETAMELTKASDMQAPGRFWTDPKLAKPRPPPQPDITVMAMEKLKADSAEKIKGAELQQKHGEADQTSALEKYKADLEAQTKLTIAQMQAQHAQELELVRGHQSAQLESHRAELNPKTKEAEAKQGEVKQKDTLIQQFMDSQKMQTTAIGAMFEQVLGAVEKLSGPKAIVRGKDGKATHVVPA